MSRIRIELPERLPFHCRIALRVTDMNYGGHVGNDRILALAHEARVQFLQSLGYEELDLAGVGLIMTDAAIEFKQELFYGDELLVEVGAGDATRVGFDLYYRLVKKGPAGTATAAKVKTGIVCYDYSLKKIVPLPHTARERLECNQA